MYYALGFYPRLSTELAEAIGAIRRAYDPTVRFVKPHITVLFPVPEIVGEGRLVSHIGNVLSDWSPFDIQLGGFHKSHDHWLFLTLEAGGGHVKSLYQSLYTGILAEYRRDDIEFVPHLGLGLFVKEGTTYNWDSPQESDFDRARYEEALRLVRELPLPARVSVETLHLMKIPDGILEGATGRRASIPENSRIVEVRQFRLLREDA
jgi:2'-5' RNA ligase